LKKKHEEKKMNVVVVIAIPAFVSISTFLQTYEKHGVFIASIIPATMFTLMGIMLFLIRKQNKMHTKKNG